MGPDVPAPLLRISPCVEDAWIGRRRPPPTLTRARRIAREVGLRHVYTGNVHDPEGQTTFCPGCGEARGGARLERGAARTGSGRAGPARAAGSGSRGASRARAAKPVGGRGQDVRWCVQPSPPPGAGSARPQATRPGQVLSMQAQVFTSPFGIGTGAQDGVAVVLFRAGGRRCLDPCLHVGLAVVADLPLRLALADPLAQVLAGRAAAGGAEREGQSEGQREGEAALHEAAEDRPNPPWGQARPGPRPISPSRPRPAPRWRSRAGRCR